MQELILTKKKVECMVQSSTDLIEKTILACIYTKPKLIDEIFVKEEYFNNK